MDIPLAAMRPEARFLLLKISPEVDTGRFWWALGLLGQKGVVVWREINPGGDGIAFQAQ